LTEPLTEPLTAPVPPVRRRILWHLFWLFCVFSLIAFSLLAWYVTTDSFQQMVRRRVVASVEKLTGGRAELGELHTIPLRLRVDARNLTIHGREAAGQAPFFHADRLQAELKIISIFSTTIGLHSLLLEHPVAHVIAYPDGTTNVPVPQASLSSGQGPVEQLISLSVSRIEVQRGELLWEDNRVPIDFVARDLALFLNYSLLRRQYEAQVRTGNITTHFSPYPPFVWRADASLVLARGRADIGSLTVTSGKSEIHFAGRLQDFHNPNLTGDYQGHADLAELASLARQPQLRKGTAQFEGRGSWSLQDFSTQGTIQSKDIEWANNKLSMRNGRFNAGFSITPARFHLSSIKANLLGGDLAGDADVTNWQTSLEAPPASGRRHVIGRVPPGSLQHGSVRLQLAAFPLLPALQMLSSRNLPLDRLDLSGNATGNVEVLWVGSIRDAETRLDLGIVPPLKPAPSEIPVRGKVEGIYRGSRDEAEVTQLHLTTPGSEIIAAGDLASSSSLRFSLTSHNLREWAPLLEAAYGSRDLPFSVHGWASLTGNASGKLSALSASGNLEAYDFDITLPATERIPSRVLHWDALSTALQYSSNHLAAHNGSLIHGHTTAHFDASAALGAEAHPLDSPFTLHFDLHNADVAEFAQLAGLAQPSAGTLDMSATVSGSRANPHGDGHLEIRNGMAYRSGRSLVDERSPPRRRRASVQQHRCQRLRCSPFRKRHDRYFEPPQLVEERVSPESFRAQPRSLPFPALADQPLHRGWRCRFHSARQRHSRTAFARSARSSQGPRPGQGARRRFLRRRGHSWHGSSISTPTPISTKPDLTIAGSVGLEHDFPADLNFAFHRFDVDSLLRIYLPGKITGHSPLDGTLHVRGPLRNPRFESGCRDSVFQRRDRARAHP
jgi:translocation and assembly module TamB